MRLRGSEPFYQSFLGGDGSHSWTLAIDSQRLIPGNHDEGAERRTKLPLILLYSPRGVWGGHPAGWHPSLSLQPQTVIGWHNANGQRLPDGLVVDIGRHVGDDGALRPEAFDPGQRVVDAEMAGMASVAQAIDDPEIEILQRAPALARDVVEVGRV